MLWKNFALGWPSPVRSGHRPRATGGGGFRLDQGWSGKGMAPPDVVDYGREGAGEKKNGGEGGIRTHGSV